MPTEEAAQLALRTQQVIYEESGVAAVADPLAGAGDRTAKERLRDRVRDRLAQPGGAPSGPPIPLQRVLDLIEEKVAAGKR